MSSKTPKHLILDPAVENVRLNIDVSPAIEGAYSPNRPRLFAEGTSVSGHAGFIEFPRLSCWVDEAGFDALDRLRTRLIAEAVGDIAGPGVTVLYNFFRPFTERAAARSRFVIPPPVGVSPNPHILSSVETSMGSGIFLWKYYLVQEVTLDFIEQQVGDSYRIDLAIAEERVRLSSEEGS